MIIRRPNPKLLYALLFAILSVFQLKAQEHKLNQWVTHDQPLSQLSAGPPAVFEPTSRGRQLPIVIDERQAFQTIDGFGFALTGGSAQLIHQMVPDKRSKLLHELFSAGDGIAISAIRLSIGASDLNSFVYTYNDLSGGQADPDLLNFSLGHDYEHVIPVLKEILAINPKIQIMASPWTAPVWMKVGQLFQGGSLRTDCYPVYDRYLLRYVQEMEKNGIPIHMITVQNEPLNSRNTPSMPFSVSQMRNFLRDHLLPVFNKLKPDTKIILFDHNCDRPDYPLTLLNDPAIGPYVDGSGFHHYGGDIGTMSLVHQARPDKNIYFTEQMVIQSSQSKISNLAYQTERLVIGTMRNWSRNMILWNLAADPNNDPHTDNGGCAICQGALTIDGDQVSRNVAYYVVAHISKFVPPGSVRVSSNAPYDQGIDITTDEENADIKRVTTVQNSGVLPNVAFLTPKKEIVLIVANSSFYDREVKVQYKGKFSMIKLAAGAVGTYCWKSE